MHWQAVRELRQVWDHITALLVKRHFLHQTVNSIKKGPGLDMALSGVCGTRSSVQHIEQMTNKPKLSKM